MPTSTVNAAPAEVILPAAETDTLPTLRIVILYEDHPAGWRAKHFCWRLARRLQDTMRFRHSLWRFDMLARPELKVMAEEHVLEADLVMITGCVDLALPAAVEKSLERWLAKKAFQDSALVALLDGSGDPAATRAPVRERLRAIARAAHMEFFVRLSGAEPDSPTR